MSAAEADDPLSATLDGLRHGAPDERVRIADVLAHLGARAHAMAIVLLAAMNLLPGPSLPGYSTVFGLPLCLIAAQLALGRRLWLPAVLAEAGVDRRRLAGVIGHAIPILRRIEGMMRPRWPRWTGDGAQRAVGVLCVIQGAAMTLPIPFYPMLPALAVMIAVLGLIARDGAAVALGWLAGAGALAALGILAWLTVAAID